MTDENGGNFPTLDWLRVEVDPMLNHLCSMGDVTLGRLVGVAEDENDFYYVVDRIHEGRVLYSAVGSVVSLNGRLPDDRYAAMNRLHEVNGCPAVEQMVVLGIPTAAVVEETHTPADTLLARRILQNLGVATDPGTAPGADARVDRIADILARYRS